MKNITVALDDDSYRQARIAAAERDTSVSALVKQYLLSLTADSQKPRDLKQEQEELLNRIAGRHRSFRSADNLSRSDLHQRS